MIRRRHRIMRPINQLVRPPFSDNPHDDRGVGTLTVDVTDSQIRHRHQDASDAPITQRATGARRIHDREAAIRLLPVIPPRFQYSSIPVARDEELRA